MSIAQNAEILIASGLHQFQHGRIASIDTSTTIPFAHIELRGKSGAYLKRSGAYVPLKYCVEIDEVTAKDLHAKAKALRKARRAAGLDAPCVEVSQDDEAEALDWS